MNLLSTIGQQDSSVHYMNRPTVKVVLQKDNKVALLNKGLLPGGGVDSDESDYDAITRELQEELGVTVTDICDLGTVLQYRSLLGKKYHINGYTAVLHSTGGATSPQDDGEARFIVEWLNLEAAITRVSRSIEEAKLKPMDTDAHQGRLYNLMTTLAFLNALK